MFISIQWISRRSGAIAWAAFILVVAASESPQIARAISPPCVNNSESAIMVCDGAVVPHTLANGNIEDREWQAPGSAILDKYAYLPEAISEPPIFDDPQLAVGMGQITIDTYNWEDGLYTVPGDAIFPYPHLNPARVNTHTPRVYATVVLENMWVRVTVLPAIGGRVIRWEDKRTGRLLTYANPVIKPAYNWGYRGWWLATGGIEWAFPVEEHGLNEYRPWQHELLTGAGWRGVRVWDLESRTGMTNAVTLRLYAGRSGLIVTPHIENTTGAARQFQFWINAMLTLSGYNEPATSLRFWVPTAQMQVHSTGDPGLPAPRGLMMWPRFWYANSYWRDFSAYSTWTKYLGVFATEWRGAAGAYDDISDQGVVRAYPASIAQGVKLFCLGDIGPAQYTDDSSRYFELWGGYNHSFFPEDEAFIQPGQVVTWDEHWYPASGIGGLNWANDHLAVSLRMTAGGVVVGLYAPSAAQARLVLRQNGMPVAQWDAVATPASPFRATYSGAGSGWDLQVWQDDVLIVQVN